MARLAISVISLLAFLVGCEPVSLLITDGFHHSLPSSRTLMVVWGKDSASESTAITWLQRRGFRVVERARLDQIFEEQAVRLKHTPDSEADILHVGKLAGAEIVVFVETSIRTRESVEFAAYGGMAAGERKMFYDASLSVRRVDVESGEIIWSGSARFTEPIRHNLDDALINLTCHALATAWGLRSPGQQDVSDQTVCTAFDARP